MSAPALTPEDLKPTIDDVAMLLRTRTVGPPNANAGGLGGDTGPSDYTTFDATTRPTDTEVQMIIDASYGTVLARLDMAPAELQDWQSMVVRHASALYAAILIEVSFFKETTNQALLDMWRSMIDQALTGVQGGGTGSESSRRFRIGTLVVASGTSELGPYAPADFMPGIDDANDDGYIQPLLVEAVGTPADRTPQVNPLYAPRRT
jgi:hypothetical protein